MPVFGKIIFMKFSKQNNTVSTERSAQSIQNIKTQLKTLAISVELYRPSFMGICCKREILEYFNMHMLDLLVNVEQ